MGKHVSVSRFSRLLQDVTTPVYVLDERQTLVYFNDSLLRWVNGDAEKLFGQVCRYHTSPSRLHHEILAAALAPPPEVWQGQRAIHVLAVDTIQEIRYRRAEFLPLAIGDGRFCVFAFVDAVDLFPEETAGFFPNSSNLPVQEVVGRTNGTILNTLQETVESAQAKELHRYLFAIRRHQSGLFQLERMIGGTPAMQTVRQQAMLAAETTAPVLIIGPPGSGREFLANTIHYGKNGERSGGLIPVDCRVLSAELIDSTIRAFYQRYAKSDRRKCHTLLLTDVDLLLPEQGKLLASVIANNPGNMRIVGTTPLEPNRWKNHPELGYQIGTLPIRIPPLTERRSDIPLLAQWFLERQNARTADSSKGSTHQTVINSSRLEISEAGYGSPATQGGCAGPKAAAHTGGGMQRTGFSADALDLLTQYHWPGNLDELANVTAEAHANAVGTLVRATDLPARLSQAADARIMLQQEEKIDLEKFLQSVELELIQRALKAAQGNKAHAARLLGMTRPRLYRRLEQLGLIETTMPDFIPTGETNESDR
ncbi:MAG: sigma 54-interacting transcriptional regulator [Planctomycetaceae bacterium]|nr:sigma 54-interacting transcriptional regulator [Planctomycetaceae bacterium]